MILAQETSQDPRDLSRSIGEQRDRESWRWKSEGQVQSCEESEAEASQECKDEEPD